MRFALGPDRLQAARAGLTSEQVRLARGLLRSGQAARDPRVARLVVALGEQQHADQIVLAGLSGLVFVTWAVVRLGRSELDAKSALVAGLAAFSVLDTALTAWRRGRAQRALSANRRLLERYGLEPVPDDVEPIVVGLADALRQLWPTVWGGAAAGALGAVIDGRVTLVRVLSGALLFVVCVVVLKLVQGWHRARHERPSLGSNVRPRRP